MNRGVRLRAGHGASTRAAWFLTLAAAASTGCGTPSDQRSGAAAPPPSTAADAQHQGVVGPHGDHSPRKGGMVLMNGDIHFEVVLSREGRHRVWFSDPVRAELPASVATGVTMTVTRPGEPAEVLALAIDDSGESWIANGRAVTGNDTYVRVRYALQGEPYEIELPFVIETPTSR